MSDKAKLEIAQYEFSLVLEIVLDILRVRDLKEVNRRNPGLIKHLRVQLEQVESEHPEDT